MRSKLFGFEHKIKKKRKEKLFIDLLPYNSSILYKIKGKSLPFIMRTKIFILPQNSILFSTLTLHQKNKEIEVL